MGSEPARPHGDPELPEPGDVIDGKYKLVRVIGHGGMGVVLEAEHLRMKQSVAIKLLKPTLVGDAMAVARFEREARNASRLGSAHATRIFDVDVTPEGVPFIVSELLEGRNLEQELRARGTLPIWEGVDYVLQACSAMAEAHGLGIVHRDLKPSNLFLARKGQKTVVKVLDFGISKAVSNEDLDLTTTGTVLGSPRYMAPEQVDRAKEVDVRTDIWSLAVILFRAITGHYPFEAEDAMSLAVAIVLKPPLDMFEFRPDVHPDLAAAAMKGLEKEPRDRYPTVDAFARAIAPFGSSGSAQALVDDMSDALPVDWEWSEAPPAPDAEPTSPGAESEETVLDTPENRARLGLEPRDSPTTRRWIAGGILFGLLAVGGVITAIALRTDEVPAPVLSAGESSASADPIAAETYDGNAVPPPTAFDEPPSTSTNWPIHRPTTKADAASPATSPTTPATSVKPPERPPSTRPTTTRPPTTPTATNPTYL